jgi:hypothetical protein
MALYELPKLYGAQSLRHMVNREGCGRMRSVALYLTKFDPRKSVETQDMSTSSPWSMKVIGSLKTVK